MKSSTNKSLVNQSKAVANKAPRRKIDSQSESQFTNHRLESSEQHQLQDLAESNPEAQHIYQLQALANNQTSRLNTPSIPNEHIIQRVRVFDENVTARDKELLQLVMGANPILMAAWQWLKNHPHLVFTIRRRDGFNSINAEFGDTEVFLNINPSEDEEKFVGTLVHEVTLHLLPWVRPMMTLELKKCVDEGTIDDYDEDQLNRIRRVLGPIADNLNQELAGDIDNKNTVSFGGNHSDMGLWALHLEGVKAVADSVSTSASVVAKALHNMRLPLLLTGSIDNAVDRGPGAYNQVIAALEALLAYRGNMTAAQREAFDADYEAIRHRMDQYEEALVARRAE